MSAEHFPTHDRRTDSILDPKRDLVAGPRLASLEPMHVLEGRGLEDPLVQSGSPHAQGVIDALPRTGEEAIERDVDSESELAHAISCSTETAST